MGELFFLRLKLPFDALQQKVGPDLAEPDKPVFFSLHLAFLLRIYDYSYSTVKQIFMQS